MDEFEKLASYYDNLGRELYQQMAKVARKLPPGMFSGRKGAMRLLGGAGVAGGSYMAGKAGAKKDAQEDDVMIANKAYQAGVKRGAMTVLQKLRSMGRI